MLRIEPNLELLHKNTLTKPEEFANDNKSDNSSDPEDNEFTMPEKYEIVLNPSVHKF
jgi:hypothetical protein